LAALADEDSGRARACKRTPAVAALDTLFRTFLATTSQHASRQTIVTILFLRRKKKELDLSLFVHTAHL
jgi:hypothetical protein